MSSSTRFVSSSLILALLALGIWGIWIVGSTSEAPPERPPLKEVAEEATRGTEEDPNARRSYELRRLRNPETGQIPKNARKKELAFGKRMPKHQRKASANSWQPRGPTNIGGRSRALGVDVSDPDSETILAGGVSGGMWRTTDGGTTWTRTFDPDQRPSVTALTQDPRPGRQDVWFAGSGEYLGNSAQGGGGTSYRGNGIYKSVDGGQSWTLLPSTTGEEDTFDSPFDYIHALEVDSSAATDGSEGTDSEVYAATFGGIQRSVDGGDSWSAVLPSGSASRTDVEVTSGGIVYAALSSDGDQPGIFTSTTGTSGSWTDITPDGWPSSFQRTLLAVNPSNADQVWALTQTQASGSGPNGHELWMYDRSTDTWTDSTEYLPDRDEGLTGTFNSQDGYDLIAEVHPDSSHLLFVGGRNLWRIDASTSATDANTWIGGYTHDPNNPSGKFASYDPFGSNPHHPDQHAIAFEPGNGDVMYVGSDGGIHRTDDNRAGDAGEAGDGSVLWSDLNNGYFTTQFYAVCQFRNPDDLTERTRIAGGMQDNGTWTTATANVSEPWDEILGGDGGYCALVNNATDDGTSRYVSSQNGPTYRLAYDETGTFQQFSQVDPSAATGQLFINPFVLDPSASDVMYYPAGSNLWRNNDLENNPSSGWTELTGAQVSGEIITALDASTKNDAHVLYYGTSQGTLKRLSHADTTASSTTPTDVTGTNFPDRGYVSSIAVDPASSDSVMVVFSNYGVTSLFYSTDGGTNWTAVEGNLGDDNGFSPSVRSAAILPQRGLDPPQTTYYVGTSIGVYSTTALKGANTNWSQEGASEIGDVVVDQVQARAQDGRVVAGTHANGTYSVSKPIPVELTGFDATVDEQSVHLTWTTASETDNSGFDIEHKYDDGTFEALDFVPGQGTATSPQTYRYEVTEELAPGRHTFRLQQTDTDGTSQYSEPQRVTLSPEGRYALTPPAPNPFRTTATMRLTVRETQPVTAVVYNTIGQRVHTLVNKEVRANHPIDLRLDGDRLASGLYVVQVRGETFAATRNVTVVK